MKQHLYNGTVTVTLDDDHCYRVDYTDAKPDGVTSILDLVPKFLLGWASRSAAEHMRDGILRRLATEGTIEPTFLGALFDEAKDAWKRKRDKAGDIGTMVHDFAERTVKLEPCPLPHSSAPEYQGCKAFLEWFRSVEIDWDSVLSERIVHSKKMFYCGTTDLVAKIGGRLSVVDFKTSSGFYDSQPLQLAAYAYALEEELGTEITDGWIIHLDKETGKCTPYFVEITPELKKDWEAVRIAWRAVKRNQERHKQIRKASKWTKDRAYQNTTVAAAPI